MRDEKPDVRGPNSPQQLVWSIWLEVQMSEATSESSELGGILTQLMSVLVPALLPIAVDVVKTLVSRRDEKLNRYQVAVAVERPASAVAPILEQMVDLGVVKGVGDINAPNARSYVISTEASPSALEA